jgi:DNA-binding NarL/FixJ family response regulator
VTVSSARVRVLIVDDHPLVRDGLRLLIGAQADLELIAEANDATMALDLARSLRPSVILIALHLCHANSADVIRQMLPFCAGVIVSMSNVASNTADATHLTAALQAGARGYLSKGAQHLEVLAAIRAVSLGGMVLGRAVTEQATSVIVPKTVEPAVSARDAFHELTDREFEVLEWLAAKKRNREIATALKISEKTVRNHISNILWKSQAKDRDSLTLKARRAGLGQTPRQEVPRLEPMAGNEVTVSVDPTAASGQAANGQAPVGREREWAQLEAAWNAGVFMYITGPAGVGKTTLMRAFAASRGGEFVEFSGLPSDTAVPYGSFARSIRKMRTRFPTVKFEQWIIKELRRIVPTLDWESQSEPQSTQVSEESKIRLFDAIAAFHVTLAPHMAGLLFDDIQFFDPLSAEASMYTLSSWERFSGKVGEAQHAIACYRSGMFPPPIEEGIRQQAKAGVVALIELEPLESNLSDSPQVGHLQQPRANTEFEPAQAAKPRIQN